MRIATFNLESLDVPPRAAVALDDRIAVLRPQLERLGADILCLQEVNGQHRPGAPERTLDALDRLVTGTPYAGFFRAATMRPGGGVADVHNLVTLSRWPLRDVRQLQNDLVPALDYRLLTAEPPVEEGISLRFDRPILIADVDLAPGPVVTVVNVHLRAPLAAPIPGQKEAPFVWKSVAGWAEGYALSAWRRTAQALEVRLAIDRILDEDPGRALVVTGDFNAEDHETPLKILVGADEDTGNGRLAPRSLVVLDRAVSADRRFSTLHHGRPQMLDHILASRALMARFRSIEVHNEALGDEIVSYTRVEHATESCHAPVVAEFARS